MARREQCVHSIWVWPFFSFCPCVSWLNCWNLSHRFAINLRCSETESGDIALHFNPRFDGKDKVVFNAFKDGSWGSEEFHSMPLTKGQAFQIVIKATSEGYQVRQRTDPADCHIHI